MKERAFMEAGVVRTVKLSNMMILGSESCAFGDFEQVGQAEGGEQVFAFHLEKGKPLKEADVRVLHEFTSESEIRIDN